MTKRTALPVDCSRCGARAGENCTGTAGKPARDPHRIRIRTTHQEPPMQHAMPARARNTDPEASHEAAATIDVTGSQAAVMLAARRSFIGPFTDKELVRALDRAAWAPRPGFSPSRIRTARRELVTLGLLQLHGLTRPVQGRRERQWEVAE